MVRVLRIATAEATRAAVAYEGLSPGLGLRFKDDFESTLLRIAGAPLEQPPWLAPRVPAGVRHASFEVFQFHVVFVLDPDPLVLAVRHHRQDPFELVQRLPT
jgi:hypothetical protein